MGEELARLQQAMAEAVEREDFEAAARLRDRIAALKAGDGEDGSLFRRQEPGRMGLGTDQQVYRPPEGWRPPRRPDPMTSNSKPRRGGR